MTFLFRARKRGHVLDDRKQEHKTNAYKSGPNRYPLLGFLVGRIRYQGSFRHVYRLNLKSHGFLPLAHAGFGFLDFPQPVASGKGPASASWSADL